MTSFVIIVDWRVHANGLAIQLLEKDLIQRQQRVGADRRKLAPHGLLPVGRQRLAEFV